MVFLFVFRGNNMFLNAMVQFILVKCFYYIHVAWRICSSTNFYKSIPSLETCYDSLAIVIPKRFKRQIHLRPPLFQLQCHSSKLVHNFVGNSYIIMPVLVRTYSMISLLSPNYVSDLTFLGEVFRSIHHNYVFFF